MLQLKPKARRANNYIFPSPESFPTLDASEDFAGTETLLRAEIKEGWQKPKEELD